jgi:hypothetical protein
MPPLSPPTSSPLTHAYEKKQDREAREARAAMLSAGARAAMREARTTSAALAEGGVATRKAVLNDQGVVVACPASARASSMRQLRILRNKQQLRTNTRIPLAAP